MGTEKVEPQLVILYGSQTGTAQKLAENLTLQAQHLFRSTGEKNTQPKVAIRLLSMDSYLPLVQLTREPGVVLFVCSTTGYGAPPDSMRTFWQRIMHRSLPPGRSLPKTLRFAVLGLGDSSYPRFNVVAKKLRHRMVQLGASPLQICLPELGGSSKQNATVEGLGLADEQAELGLYDLLSRWVPQFWTVLAGLWRCPMVSHLSPEGILSWSGLCGPNFLQSTWPRFDVHAVDSPSHKISDGTGMSLGRIQRTALSDWSLADQYDSTHPRPHQIGWFRVVKNERVTAEDHFQDTRLVEFTPQCGKDDDPKCTEFLPGDVFFLQPANNPDDVAQLLRHTGTSPTERVSVASRDPCIPVPPLLQSVLHSHPDSGVSASWLATYYFDLNAVPGPDLFTALAVVSREALRRTKSSDADHSRLELECDRLNELCSACWSADAMDDLNDYVTRPRRRVIETLLDFPVTTAHLRLTNWFDVLPGPIRARPYSIASAPPHIEILVAVVSYRTRMSTPRRGLASTHMASLSVGDTVPGWIESQVAGGFDFTRPCQAAHTQPCLLIAPGTGIAPFRSFLQHQRALKPTVGADRPSNLLFFGCRYPDKDFYFHHEWDQLEREHRLQLICAFSRLPTESGHRVYVQHRLREHAKQVWSYLSQPEALVYVAGNAKSMPTEVREALIEICQTAGALSETEAETLLNRMEAERRLQIEAWS